MTTPQWDFVDPYLWPVTVEATHIDALAHTQNTHYVEWVYGGRVGAHDSARTRG